MLASPLIRLKEAKDVRWLSHHNAVKALLRTLPSVAAALEYEAEERNDPTARGLIHAVDTFNFVASLLMMADVLPCMTLMTNLFQAKCIYVNFVIRTKTKLFKYM